MEIRDFQYVPLAIAKVDDEVIQKFDCGNVDMTEYLHHQAYKDAIEGNGVTYVLITEDRKRIYAYATLKAYSLYYYDDAKKYYSLPQNQDNKILLSIPALEIKMFAISRKLQGIASYDLDPEGKQHYSSIFFKLLLEDLYYMSMDTIGFKMIFLRANKEGERLYRNNGFVECHEYLNTFDDLSVGCVPLVAALTEIESTIFQ